MGWVVELCEVPSPAGALVLETLIYLRCVGAYYVIWMCPNPWRLWECTLLFVHSPSLLQVVATLVQVAKPNRVVFR